MARHNQLGHDGERLAEEYLQKKGYTVIERNWSYNRQEVDIIAIKDEWIIFVEVKTRSSEMWGDPEEAVTEAKVNRIVTAADFYIEDNNIEKPVRFDIISIILNQNRIDIRHFEDAFLPPVN